MAATDISGTRNVDALREGLTARHGMIRTPFGERPLVYADYTASGRPHRAVEDQINALHTLLANPHTEDSATGRASNAWLKSAETIIKRAVNASADDALIPCGAGATAAIHKLQEILGIACPPASLARMSDAVSAALGAEAKAALEAHLGATRPVVFVGPYEHHSNELSWRESMAEVVRVKLCPDGGIDFAALETLLKAPQWQGRMRIGAFSAASNVTGIISDVRRLAKLLHAHDAILALDCAASAPYLAIDMHPADEPDAYVDAISFSPHKFVGGPGSCGVLVFNKALYRNDLPPTCCAGGTVRYVWDGGHDFLDDVEAREKAGTPGLPQLVRAALALELRDALGLERLHRIEQDYLERAFAAWQNCPGVEILGPQDPSRRLAIVSFNLRDPRGGWLHPRFVTTLLSDLFGIQARAGCACAGPYAHDLLGLGEDEALAYRDAVLSGHAGVRPGWSRVSLHWAMDEAEIGYIVDAIAFLAAEGWKFLDLYRFDLSTGAWSWRGAARMDAREAICGECPEDRGALFAALLDEARTRACALSPCPDARLRLPEPVERLRQFSLPTL
ncbi:aminotransferase class V-fold PLP-dependent enzyme [Glycocaulis abyssi]|uniref:Aminotransferase class V-fold PLP-dependent enzyme n=1 Tax=Glycocaulis abyssi TaxID=1433403 RepID=A0ABV9N7C0_9PROT